MTHTLITAQTTQSKHKQHHHHHQHGSATRVLISAFAPTLTPAQAPPRRPRSLSLRFTCFRFVLLDPDDVVVVTSLLGSQDGWAGSAEIKSD